MFSEISRHFYLQFPVFSLLLELFKENFSHWFQFAIEEAREEYSSSSALCFLLLHICFSGVCTRVNIASLKDKWLSFYSKIEGYFCIFSLFRWKIEELPDKNWLKWKSLENNGKKWKIIGNLWSAKNSTKNLSFARLNISNFSNLPNFPSFSSFSSFYWSQKG